MRRFRGMSLTILLLVTFVGCGGSDVGIDVETTQALKLKMGYYCTVQFRRDALGAASANGIPATTGSMNGAEMQVTGILKGVKGEFLVIEVPRAGDPTKMNEYWIPRHSILLLEWAGRADGSR